MAGKALKTPPARSPHRRATTVETPTSAGAITSAIRVLPTAMELRLGGVSFVFTPSFRGGSGSPLVCLHGFTDTWRTWGLVLPSLEPHPDVLARTRRGPAGGPRLPVTLSDDTLPDAIERVMDEAGFERAHLVGNSLGGYLAPPVGAPGGGA